METILSTVPAQYRKDFPKIWKTIMEATENTGIHPAVFLAIIKVESNFNKYAANVNSQTSGNARNSIDKGLMQINSYYWGNGFNVVYGDSSFGRMVSPVDANKSVVAAYNIEENIMYAAIAILGNALKNDNYRRQPTIRNLISIYHHGHIRESSAYLDRAMQYVYKYTALINNGAIGIDEKSLKSTKLIDSSSSTLWIAILAAAGIAIYLKLEGS